MANFPTPAQINTQYLTILKSVKPSLNINDQNSDFVIRSKPISGVASGLYGDQKKVNLDTWINSCRPESLTLFGLDYNILQQPATPAQDATVQLNGTPGTIVSIGLVLMYIPTGVLYEATSGGTIGGGGTLVISVVCELPGAIGNIAYPDTLLVVSPPAGLSSTATLLADMADGSDAESTDSYRARLLTRVQFPPAGGNETDYPTFAFLGDPSVRSATIVRFDRGLGTVGIYITTGTTDINTAVTQGLSIVRIPSNTVINNVQAYYDAHVPLTDCPAVYAPTEVDVGVSVYVDLATGLTFSSIPSDPVNNPLNLTVYQLIQREVSRVLYKLPVGGRLIPGLSGGYVTATDIEAGLGVWLSAVVDPVTGLVNGMLPILTDWQVEPLNPPHYDLPVTGSQLAAPGTITPILGVP